MKIQCNICQAEILPTTASRTGGLCMPCHKNPNRNDPSQIVMRSRETPARCLSPFSTCSVVPMMGQIEKEPGHAIFTVNCKCGSSDLGILGFPMTSPGRPDQDIFAATIYLKCNVCGKTEPVFNPDQDGYDAEIGSSSSVVGTGGPSAFPCANCGHTEFKPEVSLEYSLEDEELDDWEELAEKPQDFFTWFSLKGMCSNCGHSSEVTDYECA